MIKLERIITPAAIPDRFRGAKRIRLHRLLLQGYLNGTVEFDHTQWKAAKEQLKTETNRKCAYCEAPVDVVDLRMPVPSDDVPAE